MLIIEIILTILAWKGYKWLALVPLGSAVGIGLIVGANGGDLDGLWIIDVIAIIILIVMVVVKKDEIFKKKEEKIEE